MKIFIIPIIVFFVILTFSAYADMIIIPDDYPTIQQGIDAGASGDTVLVHPGTYVENVNFNGQRVFVTSMFLLTGDSTFISTTIIDGDSSGSVVSFLNGEDRTAVLNGFTITNGNYSVGGGIFCDNGSCPMISNNIIRGNLAEHGGGICCMTYSDPFIYSNIIDDNMGGLTGGGITCYLSNPVIEQNIITNNFSYDWGAGIDCELSGPEITNNTIAYNIALAWGSGINVSRNSGPAITNCIFWANHPPQINNDFGYPSFSYCDINGGYEGSEIIDIDPLFVAASIGNFNICSCSPVIDAGDPNILDPDGTRSDIGVFFPQHPDCDIGKMIRVSTSGNDTTGNGSPQNPYRTVQHSIDVSYSGDTIMVENGTYGENVKLLAKNIFLTSNFLTSGDTLDIINTVIDGQSDTTVIMAEYCDSSTVISGLTITNGNGWLGGGIISDYCALRIENNHIVDNISRASGGGLYCSYDNAVICNNFISGNLADYAGGGIDCYYSAAIIRNNIMTSNSAYTGGGVYYGGKETVSFNLIMNNDADEGGGITCFGYSPLILNNTVVGNTSDLCGGIYCSYSGAEIMNNILWDNQAAELSYEGGHIPVVSYCDIRDTLWPGTGNISENPEFVDPHNHYYQLSWESPCINSGNPAPQFNDPDSTRSDMGAFYFPQGNIIIDMRPVDPPISVPAGRSFRFDGFIANNTPDQQVVDLWISVIVPGYGYYGPVGLFQNNPMAPHDTLIGLRVRQHVPRHAPTGFYTYLAYCGTFPDNIIDSCFFGFDVTAPMDGNAEGWGVEGWLTESEEEMVPSELGLMANYPNPFNSATVIRYALPSQTDVRIDIFNLRGQLVETLIDGKQPAGLHDITWNASLDGQAGYASGIYFYRLKAGEKILTRRMTLLK